MESYWGQSTFTSTAACFKLLAYKANGVGSGMIGWRGWLWLLRGEVHNYIIGGWDESEGEKGNVCVGQIREIIIELMRENEENEDRNFQLITDFIKIIKQEKLSPALLEFQREMFDQVQLMVKSQRSNLREYLQLKQDFEINVATKNFKYMIYNSEIEKIDYLLKTYLKTRLKKIQLFCFHLVKNEHQAEKLLSAQELIFLRKYSELRYKHYKDNVFKFLIKDMRDFKGIEITLAKAEEATRERKVFVETKQSQVQLKSPNLKEHVFAQILTNPKQLRFGLDLHASNTNKEQMDVISPGTIIFGPYKNIVQRFETNQFRLI